MTEQLHLWRGVPRKPRPSRKGHRCFQKRYDSEVACDNAIRHATPRLQKTLYGEWCRFCLGWHMRCTRRVSRTKKTAFPVAHSRGVEGK